MPTGTLVVRGRSFDGYWSGANDGSPAGSTVLVIFKSNVRGQLTRTDLVLQTAQDAIKSAVPFFKQFGEIPSGRLEGSRLGRVEGMKRGYKGGNDGFIVFDKESLEGEQELVDVCELEDALICDLKGGD